MFAERPSGGSVTTLSDLCKIPSGNLIGAVGSIGLVVNQRRKPLSGLFKPSIVDSRVFNQEVSK
jgi:hypothetical protein